MCFSSLSDGIGQYIGQVQEKKHLVRTLKNIQNSVCKNARNSAKFRGIPPNFTVKMWNSVYFIKNSVFRRKSKNPFRGHPRPKCFKMAKFEAIKALHRLKYAYSTRSMNLRALRSEKIAILFKIFCIREIV
jgi:hypothetical protein